MKLGRIGLAAGAALLLAACSQSPTPLPQAKTTGVQAQVVSDSVVISQVYGGGGNSGATLKNDFIELFNRGTAEVDLSTWSVQYASSSGTSWQRTNLSGKIQPGQYYLIRQAAGTGGSADLPTPDASGSIAMSGTAGKVALVNSQTTLSGSCPAAVDFVGFGSATNCFEGAATANLSNTAAAIRKDGGCTETDSNSADFEIAGPSPRNTASARNYCGEAAPTLSLQPGNGAVDIAPNANLTLTFSEEVSLAAEAVGVSCSVSGAHSVSVSGGPKVFTADPSPAFVDGDVCTVTVSAAKVSDLDALDPPDGLGADFTSSFTVADVCVRPFTPIPSIQGSGATVALTGSQTTQGVVVGDYEGASPGLRGFYMQDPSGDGDAATSDAIFVFEPDNANRVALGDVVRVVGTAGENQGQSQIISTNIVNCGTGTVSPVEVSLPVASADYLERFEGMVVRFPQTLYVTEHFQLGRFGQVVLSANGRLKQPTNVVAPGAAALALQAQNNLNRIIVDDASQGQNPDPILFARSGQPLSASNTLRGGDTTTGLVGVLTYTWAGNSASGNAYRVRPINALGGSVSFVAANPRPTSAPAVGGSLKAVGMNLLNYFNTFSGCTNGVGGLATDCRGAGNAFEFERQRSKTVAAIVAMNPDVLGFNEMENDGYGPDSAVASLVGELNSRMGASTYAYLNVDSATGKTNVLGTDAIKVGFIYKPAVVAPVGQTAVLDSTAFVNGGDSAPRNRVSLAQAFQQHTTAAIFIANINHLKSKGSACDAPDAGDGQGNCSAVRTYSAQLLTAWLASNPTGIADPDILMIGDYNSYAKEDPITAIKNAGYINLIESRLGLDAYSYVFDGQWGYLDHALASSSLNGQVSGVADYHINADEPSVLDYNTDFKTPNLINTLFAPDQFRVSDHDPVLVGLGLNVVTNWFGSPVANFPAYNTVNAGQIIPLKFSLGGYKGTHIFAPGYPKWEVIACGSTAPVFGTNSTQNVGALGYDPALDQYTYTWKTEKSWAGSCRQLVVQYTDGTSYRANFQFVK